MCGTPQRSRTTRTGFTSPSTASVPETCGSGATRRCGVGRPHAAAATTHSRAAGRTTLESDMGLKESLLAEFDHEMGTTRRLLERVPAERLAWKPHDKSMSVAELATHLGNIPNWAAKILNNDAFDLADAPPNLEPRTSRADILAAFDQSTKAARSLLDRTDAEFMGR